MHHRLARSAAITSLLLTACPAFLSTGAAAADDVVTLDGRHWATATNGPFIKWPDAETYCAGLVLDGHEDWRLPTLMELESLYDPETPSGIQSPISLEGCCLWSGTSLEDRAAEDGDEIAGTPDMYRWGFMFDGGHHYYAVHIFEDGKALCTRDD